MAIATLRDIDRIVKSVYGELDWPSVPVPVMFSRVADRSEWVAYNGSVHRVIRTPMGSAQFTIDRDVLDRTRDPL